MNDRKTILVTGGAGFMGSAFVRRLFCQYRNYHIIVLDALTYAGNPHNLPDEIKQSCRFEFWYGNILNTALVEALMQRADVVVHFAAETHVSRSIYDDRIFFETDVLGTQTLLNAAVKNRSRIERFIHISTSEVYGTARKERMDEEHPLEPCSPYAAAKTGADRLVYSYTRTYDLPTVTLRPFNNYGPYQHLEKVVPRFITSALQGEPLTVHGDGSAKRDWIYVEDTVRAIDMAMHAPIAKVGGLVLNIASGRDVSILQVAHAVLRAFDLPATQITFIPDRPGQVQHHIADTRKADRVLKFSSEIDFKQGLESTIAWYKSNRAWYEPLLWMRHVKIRCPDGTVQHY